MVRILLVDDTPSEVRLMTEALNATDVQYRMEVAATGDEALAYISRSHPDLVLLDLNLPGMSGQEVLREVKSHRETSCIPVIILSSSRDDLEIAGAYASYANCYLAKPTGFDELVDMVRSMVEFWFRVVQLPPNHA